jgi:transcriptional regulator with XRE-family HTH domain
MMSDEFTPGWATSFPWERYGAAAQDEAFVSPRLSNWLQRAGSAPAQEEAPQTLRRFGRYMAALRETHGWSRLQVAREAGIDPLAVPLLEHGLLPVSEVTPELVRRLAAAFRIPLHQLAINPLPQPDDGLSPARDGFGVWLKSVLQLALGPRLALSSGGTLSSLDSAVPVADRPEVLPQPVELPEQAVIVMLPDGPAAGKARLVLEAGQPSQRGAADLHVRLLDDGNMPLVNMQVLLDLEGLPYQSEQPTDARGVTRLRKLPLAVLAALTNDFPALIVRPA